MAWFSKVFFLIWMMFNCSCIYGRRVPCSGEFGVSVEWLYGHPAIEDPDFALVLSDVDGDDISFIPNNQSWHSGYRVDLTYNFCYCPIDIRFRWTHFPSFSDSRTVSGPPDTIINLFTSQQEATFEAGVKETFNFYYADLLLGWEAIDRCPFLLSLQGGVQYAHLRFVEKTISRGLPNGTSLLEGQSKSCMVWGIGPEIGADFNFSFWNCFGLAARSYASLLISKQTVRAEVERGPIIAPNIEINCKDYIYLRPFFNTRAGFNYSRLCDLSCFSCLGPFTLDIEVGYEASWLFNSVGRITDTDVVIAASPSSDVVNWMTFTIHGPYVHVGVAF